MTDNFEDLADEAFEDSAQYEYNGTPLYFSYRHYYALLAIMAESEMSAEEQVLLIFWIATHDGEKIKELRRNWRKDKDFVFDEFEAMPEIYELRPGSNELLEIADIAGKIWSDVENSKDQIKESKSNENSPDTSPKK
jgi:hypothetical protein